jgi:lipopolysaccharide transport system permease protein
MSTQIELPKPLIVPAGQQAPAEETRSVTRIRPPQGWQLIDVRELWRFRELVYFLIWRDVKVRYKQTVLGAAWAILQPAMMMVVFTIFFSRMAKVPAGSLPYPVFAFAGLLPWTFFATAITNAGNSVVGSERLITKIYFPRLAIPLGSVGAAVVDFIIGFGLLAMLMVYAMVYHGMTLSPNLLLAPVAFAVILVAAIGVGTLLAALNVSYRDFRYVIPFLVQIWMFATPTVYMQLEEGTSGLRSWLALNPMTGLIATFRAATLGDPIPWSQFAISSVCAVVLLAVGCLYYRRVEDHFADII